MNRFIKLFLLSVALTSTLTATHTKAELISKVTPAIEHSEGYWKLINIRLGKYLNVPPFFTTPVSGYAPIKKELLESTSAISPNAPVLLNYSATSHANTLKFPETQLGLRMVVVNAFNNRKKNSMELGESTLFEPGDVVLSFRPEWWETLRYAHIQLGVSHAALLYIEKGTDGKNYLKNLDMPMDKETVADGFLSSKHYQEAPLLSIVRARMTPAQKENVNKWIMRLAKVGPAAYAAGKLKFNTDYSNPNFRVDKDLSFVADLGRIALGITNKEPLREYCSEFVWNVLSLRDCNIDDVNVQAAFKNDAVPSCVNPIFTPMPILGSITTDTVETENTTVGLLDGMQLILRTQVSRFKSIEQFNAVTDQYAQERGLGKAGKKPKDKISSNHVSLEAGILKANPAFYDQLLAYMKLSNDKGADQNQMVLAVRNGFNAANFPNYSPTAYMVHAALPISSKLKAFDYVATIFYASTVPMYDARNRIIVDAKGKPKMVEAYPTVRKIGAAPSGL